jgi:AcrR family transcriptional regulator
MTSRTLPSMSWAERAADRSPSVQRSRSRSVQQAKVIVDAARRLVSEKGDNFTTQELVKEAGVALQTFYRYFGGKDQLLLAVIEDLIAESTVRYAELARDLPDPVARLRLYIVSAVTASDQEDDAKFGARFVTSEHWRLHQLFPDELSEATRPFRDLVAGEIRAAVDAGLLHPADPTRDAWLIEQLVMAVFHHFAYATVKDEGIGEALWQFCLAALGGVPAPAAGGTDGDR